MKDERPKIVELDIERKVDNYGGRIFNEVASNGSYGGKAVAKDPESG